ncbi:hypothetical protein ABB37_04142 [Leptomonas pyrrhocoris]|uniref:T4 RNA ligase 1-like N-terminal domain-containing protein n=1 Tax=Leptomonas pyrrhocoris TaxID=157538 RepID=A0A0N0VFZ0_LEPPY|nr:hypothetical protein ABB37_04142 [Leptomonas pyrrhocoris]KPA81898.1 hypothetical protein ABB37_04142 [Leptomonas pyrrhocoris]|eukprot:XP_015660337.1 hypothetical protein ABB37_04142 [Leptomonas pyrrhocoris]
MDALKSECWFRCEQSQPTSTHIDLRDLESYVARGRASTSSAELSNGRQIVSVSVKDASQGDVNSLPCGARSLLIEEGTGAIVCRGINKFFDISEVSDAWLSDPALWANSVNLVWAVRKMAGFVVTVFSLDGIHLEVMSKHVLAGPHVDAAHQLLAKLDNARRALMASDLFSWGACASFECIWRAEDHQHPVLEADVFDAQLVLIAVLKRTQLREESVGFAAMATIAAKWSVRSAPAVVLQNSAALHDVMAAAETWKSVYPLFTECPILAEGFVVLIEVAAGQAGRPHAESLPWCCPIRLKLKTPKYVVLRAFRSLVMGDSNPPMYLYHQGFLGWLTANTAVEEIRTMMADVGVSRLSDQFEAALHAKARTRYRDASETVGRALAQLQDISARAANPRGHCRLFVLVLCGLPGAGKTTVSKALLKMFSADSTNSSLHFMVHVSRDAVSRDVGLKHGIDDNSSKHKQRRLRALVHQELCDEMRDVARLSQEGQLSGLLVFDACNATRASRQAWRRCFPSSLEGYQIVYVDCPDASISAQRAADRDDHEVLHNAAEAQHALYTVRKKFQPPTAEEACWYVDTNTHAAEAAAFEIQRRLIQQLTARQEREGSIAGRPSASTVGPPPAMTVASVRAQLQQSHATLLQSLLGVPESTAAQLKDVASFLALKRKAKFCSLQVRLCCSAKSLRAIAADVLFAALCPSLRATEAPASSLVTAGRRLVRQVAAALWGNASSAAESTGVAGTIARGHLKWLRGWLLHGKAVKAPSDIAAALQERFEGEASRPHVTLLHGGATTASSVEDAMHKYLAAEGFEAGEEVVVRVKSLLLDRHAICFGVALSSGQALQGVAAPAAKRKPVPLHITVATVDGTAAVHAGDMFASFERWESENAVLLARQQTPQQQVNRSQHKFHNFVEFQLITEVELQGVVELHLQ